MTREIDFIPTLGQRFNSQKSPMHDYGPSDQVGAEWKMNAKLPGKVPLVIDVRVVEVSYDTLILERIG